MGLFLNFIYLSLTLHHIIFLFQGVCIILAPKRSGSFDRFVELARKMFIIDIEENYDDMLWSMHEEFKSNSLYDPDLHYPILIKISNNNS